MTGFAAALNFPFATGSTDDTLVPRNYPVSVDGHCYLLDDTWRDWVHQSIAEQRPSITDEATDESALNPEVLLRRSMSTWHKGAGQRHADRPDSQPERFWKSLGVDVWTRWQLTLLPDVDSDVPFDNEWGLALTADGWLYITSDVNVWRTQDLDTYAAITGAPVTSSITSDGGAVYLAGPDAVYRSDTGGAIATAWANGSFPLIGYVKGRLLAARAGSLFNLQQNAPKPEDIPNIDPKDITVSDPFFTASNPDWTWDCFAEGNVAIYAAGHAGDYAAIYRIFITEDGTDLNAPVLSAELPRGEVVTSLLGYLGFVIVGTTKGVRLSTIDEAGELTLGAYIPTPHPVRCLTADERFVWFGWSDYDSSHTGLGRLDLTVINDSTPAYATDLMAPSQGEVRSVVRFDGRTHFTTAANLYSQSDSLVESGSLDTGLITFDVAEEKVGYYVKVSATKPLVGGYDVFFSADEGAFVRIGRRREGVGEPEATVPVGQRRGETMELRLVLVPPADTADTLRIRRITLLALAAPTSGVWHILPLLLSPQEIDLVDRQVTRDVKVEYDFLAGLRASKQLVPLREGSASFDVVLDDFEWRPRTLLPDKKWWAGTFVAKLKAIHLSDG